MAPITAPASVTDVCLAAKRAARGLGATGSAVKDAALEAMPAGNATEDDQVTHREPDTENHED